MLSRIEEILLVAVHRLDDHAYGVSIRACVEEIVERKYSTGAIYVPLERLAANGLLLTREAEPTAVRGGRRKKFYRMSKKGRTALAATALLEAKLWKHAAEFLPKGAR